jgi:hypothetical protein
MEFVGFVGLSNQRILDFFNPDGTLDELIWSLELCTVLGEIFGTHCKYISKYSEHIFNPQLNLD